MQIPVGRPKDLEKRQRILSVAKALFLAHGYHASSMNQIAREAGVTKLTVYNHFQDKATLFSCAIEDTCEAILHEHPQLLQPGSDFAQEFYQASHSKLDAVWNDFFALAQQYRFIQVDLPEKQTELIVSLLTGIRHQKILLGLSPPPSSAEQQQIISEAIELFMLKYALPD